MKQRHIGLTLFVIIGGILFGFPFFSYAQTDPNWQVGLSFSTLNGDYGQDEDTSVFYSTATVKKYLKKGDVALIVPFIDISEDGAAFVDGGVEAVSGAAGGSGIGDIILKGRYYTVEQEGLMPFIDLVGSIKFPSADEDKGLGTGKTDLTFMAEFARVLENKKWTALAELGYTFVGDPDGYDVSNRWLYSLGLAYKLNQKITLTGYLDGRTAIYPGNEDPLSILLGSEFKVRPDIRFDTSLEIGLNDGSPDIGITIGLRKRF